MKITRIMLSAAILLSSVFSLSARAEDRAEIFLGYSYLHFTPTITGLNARSFNGGGIGAELNFLKVLGIKADLMGYESTTFTRTVPVPIILPGGGSIPAGTYTGQGNMFTYLFGPEIRIPLPKAKLFGEVLAGGSYTDGYVNLSHDINESGGNVPVASQHPFTLALGGGLDIEATKRLAIRVGEFDYVLTRYSNPLTNASTQNNFRYCGGLVLKF
jgi:Outer membrane protein beta-barrel domain